MTSTLPAKPIAAQYDIASNGSLCVGIARSGGLWLTADCAELVRIEAGNLRDAARREAVARELHPDATLLVDVEVVIAGDAQSARRRLAALDPATPATLRYVGTPVGLAGLIADIHTLRIADGVVLIPLDRTDTVDLIPEVFAGIGTFVPEFAHRPLAPNG